MARPIEGGFTTCELHQFDSPEEADDCIACARAHALLTDASKSTRQHIGLTKPRTTNTYIPGRDGAAPDRRGRYHGAQTPTRKAN